MEIIFRSKFMAEDNLDYSGYTPQEATEQFYGWWNAYGKNKVEAYATIIRVELGRNEDLMEKTLHLKELLLADVIEAEIKLSKAKIETAMNTIKTTRIK